VPVLKTVALIVAEVQVNVQQEGVGVPEFLNYPWTKDNQIIIVNVTEETSGHIVTLVARDSLTHEPIRIFRKIAGDSKNLFTVSVNGKSFSRSLIENNNHGPHLVQG